MKLNDVRQKFLDFFKERGHYIIPSYPLVPQNDPTTLFTSSGMQPLIPYLMGQPHPHGKRLANSQYCFRAEDIEEIGDNRHTTFFEMLGNWSLGDYWKEEQLNWYFEFLVDVVGLDPKRLYVTCYIGDADLGIPKDTESAEIWKEIFGKRNIDAKEVEIGSEENGYSIGTQGGRIFYYKDKNWWSRSGTPDKMPVGEIGGGDSEVFFDTGKEHDKSFGEHCHPNCDCGKFVEIGNSVFIEYKKEEDGSFSKLQQRNIDHGSGLLRITAAANDTSDIFTLDVFSAPMNIIKNNSTVSYEESPERYRIILDHIRASLFMLNEGVIPSNKEAGYILRRLLRRSIMSAIKLDMPAEKLTDILNSFASYYSISIKDDHLDLVKSEITKFNRTIQEGTKQIEKGNKDPFILYTTYGLPLEIIKEIVGDINEEEFKRRIDEHKQKSKTHSAGRFKGGLADNSETTTKLHTAHHLLLSALQKHISKDIHQRGSNITPERLRMDFSFDRKLTEEEISKVENQVNEWISQGLPVTKKTMPLEEAVAIGAEREFMAKYPEKVTVYFIGNEDNYISIELCGGPHVQNTSEIGGIEIVKETASSKGVRRIKARLK